MIHLDATDAIERAERNPASGCCTGTMRTGCCKPEDGPTCCTETGGCDC